VLPPLASLVTIIPQYPEQHLRSVLADPDGGLDGVPVWAYGVDQDAPAAWAAPSFFPAAEL